MAGLVKSGWPFTPTTIPAPSGTNAQHLVVIAAGKIDLRCAALCACLWGFNIFTRSPS